MQRIVRCAVLAALLVGVAAGCGKKRGGYFGPAPVSQQSSTHR